MKKSYYVLAFLAAVLFAIAGIISMINGSVFRGALGFLGALSFILAGVEWRRRTGSNDKS
jgi:hypothetical protein